MSSLTLTRIAHASVLIDFGGTVLLTDPWFSEKRGYYHGEPYGVALDRLPRLAGVVGSHAHYDHFDMASFGAYPDKAVPFALQTGMAAAARRAGFTQLTELEPWQSTDLGGVRVTAAPAAHGMPENSYVLEKDGLTVYFGGDTLLIPELAEVGRRFLRIDLALLSVNGLQIRPLLSRQVVMNAREAAMLCAVLRPRVAVPMHYAFTAGPVRDRLLLRYTGTAAAFAREAAAWAPDTTVRILAPGEPLHIDGPTAA